MSIKSFIVSVVFSAIMLFAALMSILYYFKPANAGKEWMILFYATFFLFCISLFILASLSFKKIVSGKRLNIADFMNSFRQAALFSSLLTICLLLQSFWLLAWWNALLLAAAAVFLEFCFLMI